LLAGCQPGTPPDCEDLNACTIDACNESLNRCDHTDQCCGDGDLDPGEQCEPPNVEDCNNGTDDDGDGRPDCRDVDCADPTNPLVGIVTCGLDCKVDMPCTKIRRDPAFITFGKDGRPDRLRIHGRFKLESTADPLAEGLSISLTNDNGSIYRGQLLPGDMKASGSKFVFKDATASSTGVGIRDGIASARIKFQEFEGEPYLNFILIAYGDLSAATEPWMTSQIVVGNDTGFLRAQWILLKNGWKLHDKTFF
jgi:hypothetical protein